MVSKRISKVFTKNSVTGKCIGGTQTFSTVASPITIRTCLSQHQLLMNTIVNSYRSIEIYLVKNTWSFAFFVLLLHGHFLLSLAIAFLTNPHHFDIFKSTDWLDPMHFWLDFVAPVKNVEIAVDSTTISNCSHGDIILGILSGYSVAEGNWGIRQNNIYWHWMKPGKLHGYLLILQYFLLIHLWPEIWRKILWLAKAMRKNWFWNGAIWCSTYKEKEENSVVVTRSRSTFQNYTTTDTEINKL